MKTKQIFSVEKLQICLFTELKNPKEAKLFPYSYFSSESFFKALMKTRMAQESIFFQQEK
jgi:hypothetical protein